VFGVPAYYLNTGDTVTRRLLTAREAASYLRLAPVTLAKLRLTGGGPRFAKLGSRVLYDQGDLDSWVDARMRRSTSDLGACDTPAAA
jgi:hypothetical protein